MLKTDSSFQEHLGYFAELFRILFKKQPTMEVIFKAAVKPSLHKIELYLAQDLSNHMCINVYAML